MKKAFAFALFGLLLFGCAGIGTTPLEDLNNDPAGYKGKEVTVHGTVTNTIKIGQLSGYTLVDEEGHGIRVSSASLPAEGKEITITGVFMQDSIFGYYIQVPN
ncbi:MAG: hypothetical protein GY852_08775 [bacterium]|nr:hypothetical protein [bacterium]